MKTYHSKLVRVFTLSGTVLLFCLVVLSAVISPPQRPAHAYFSDAEIIDVTFSTNTEVANNYLKNIIGWVEFAKNKMGVARAFVAIGSFLDLKINGTDNPQVVSFLGMKPGVWGDYSFTLSVAQDREIYYVFKPVYQEGGADLFNTLSMELYNGSERLFTVPFQNLVSWCRLFQPESSDSFTVRINKRADQNFADINGSVRFHLMITAVQATNNPDFCSSTDNPPTLFDLTQFDGSTSIGEGGTIHNSSVGFFAYINDPENNQVKLQVELRQINEPFTGNSDGGILTSDLVTSGSGVKVNRTELSDGAYHWRARAVDEHGNESGWQEFRSIGNTDFEIRTNEPPIASFTFEPSSPKVGDSVTFDASSSYDPDETSISFYAWDWENDGLYDFSKISTNQHVWLIAGTYTVRLKVFDDKGAVGTTELEIIVTAPNETSTANILNSLWKIGTWTYEWLTRDYNALNELDEWLRDNDGDNKPDEDSASFDWLKGTRCAGVGENFAQKICLMNALDRNLTDTSDITYLSYITKVMQEEKTVEGAFMEPTPRGSIVLSLSELFIPDIASIALNDITTAGVEEFVFTSLQDVGETTASLFQFGSGALSYAIMVATLHEDFGRIDEWQYHQAIAEYFLWRGLTNPSLEQETFVWETYVKDTLSGQMSGIMLNETKIKFEEWWHKYWEIPKNGGMFNNDFKQKLRGGVENVIKYGIKTSPK